MFDKRLMQACPESRIYILGNIALQWVELMLNAVMIWMIAQIAGRVYEGSETGRDLAVRICLLAAALFARWFATKGAIRMSYLASRTVKRVMREKIYQKLLRLGVSYREHATTAELVQESVEGVEQLESYFGQYVPQFFYAFLAPGTLFFLFGAAGSFQVAAVLLICVPLIPGAIMMVQKIAKKLLSKYWDQYAKLGSTFLENLQGMTTLKTYQADGWKNEQMNVESEHFRTVTMKVLTMQLNSIIIMDFFAYGGAALGIALACRRFQTGRIGLAAVIFMILLSADFFLPMRKLGSYFHVAMNGMAASDRIFKFLGEQEPAPKEKSFPAEGFELELQDVCFSYVPEREVLSGISMKIVEGSLVGIVGRSGSGKSTVASLLMGRNTVSAGKITIQGVNLQDIREDSLLRNMNYVGPDSVFFKGTVRDNLLLANPKATEEMLWAALEECSIAGFFRGEKGLDTALLENAGNLSGGQRQRLALARALLHDAGVYVFDEATSNVDAESEEVILREIRNLAKNAESRKTILVITHRLANVTDADQIFCLEKGRLAGSGTHEELLSSCPAYRELWKVQRELETFGKEGES